jgi:DNA mismatch endonuclease (patch repair protein)
MKETLEARSRIMRAVKSRDTTPELAVRRLAHRMGYRFRLHRKDLPGKPDLVFPGRHRVIFVHGCFWHGHDCARGARVPKGNREYWLRKIKCNRERDGAACTALTAAGWKITVFWECELRDAKRLRSRLSRFLK